MNLRLQRLAAASLMAISGSLSLPAVADSSSGTMSPAELKALKEAYAAGYKAAHGEVAGGQSGGAAQAAPARKIIDMKETYSDAGDVETVQQIPVSSAPLQDGPRASQKAPAPHAVKVAHAARPAAAPAPAPAQAPSTDQLVAEFCSATASAHAADSPAPQPARPVTATAREDQVPDEGDEDAQAVTPQQFEADAQAYAREMARNEDGQADAPQAAQQEMQTASADAPPPSGSAPPRRFWSEQYHTWVTVGNSGQ